MPDKPPPEPTIADLAAAAPEEIAEALSYALRFDERGKPRKSGWDFAAGVAAERLADRAHRDARPTRPTAFSGLKTDGEDRAMLTTIESLRAALSRIEGHSAASASCDGRT